MTILLSAFEKLSRSALASRGFVGRTASAGAEKVHAFDAQGTGTSAPIVFFHGIGASATTFAPVAPRLLSQSKRVVLLDLAGHGLSGDPAVRPLTPRALFRAATHALDALLDEPFVLVGNSLGGAAAIAHALARPKSVRGLFLISPTGAQLPHDEGDDVLTAFRATGRAAGNAFLDKVYHRTPFYARLLAHEMPAWLSRAPVRELLDHAQEISFSPEELGSLVPKTVLSWGKSERLLPPSGLAYLKEHLPSHVKVEEPEGFGHCPQLDDPRALAKRLREFLREVG